MRGKGVQHRGFPLIVGITPAYAGKSDSPESGGSRQQDHPRLCGEKRGGIGTETHVQGSPPPMRGKANTKKCKYAETRITPAYAGKSHFQW